MSITHMPVTQRCNNAGPLGKPIPTRSLRRSLGRSSAFAVLARLRGLAATLPRLRH